jgi:predicted Zn finger-like uncharacterized protein
MAISIKCPECQVRLKVGDDRAGEKVECPQCGATFTAPEDAEPAPAAPRRKSTAADDEDDEEGRPARSKGRKPAPASRRRRDDDDDEDERPRRSRRPNRRQDNPYTIVFVLIGVAVFVLIGVGAGAWAFTRKKPETTATTAPAPPGPSGMQGGPQPPAPAPKGNPPPKGNALSNNSGKIEGTKWRSMGAFINGRNIPAGALKLDFAADGGLRYETPLGVFTGTYTLDPGDKVVLNLDQVLAGSMRHEERVVIKGDRLTMSDSDGTAMTFEKVR